MKVYISGPMTGLPELNFPAFNEAARALRAMGHEVVNPADLNPPGTSWDQCMRADIAALVTCGAVALLPGWAGSRGARLEAEIARQLGMPTVDLMELVGDIESAPVIELDMDAIYSKAVGRSFSLRFECDGAPFVWAGRAKSQAAAELMARGDLAESCAAFSRFGARLVEVTPA